MQTLFRNKKLFPQKILFVNRLVGAVSSGSDFFCNAKN